jgi:glutaredoxin
VATLYVSSEFCPHCRPARKFLRARGIRFIERDIVDPRSAQQLMDLHLTFHQRGHTVPSLEVHGRGLIGFAHDGVDTIVAWRRATRDRTGGRR